MAGVIARLPGSAETGPTTPGVMQCGGSNSGPYTSQASPLPTEPRSPSFIKMNPCPGSALLQVSRVTSTTTYSTVLQNLMGKSRLCSWDRVSGEASGGYTNRRVNGLLGNNNEVEDSISSIRQANTLKSSKF